MTLTIELREYQRRELEISTDVVARLSAAAGSAVSFSATAQRGTWSVAASSTVGNIVVPGAQIVIRPKVSIENLFVLLDAGMPPASWRDEIFGYASQRDLLSAFASFFARTVDRLTARGLARSYRPEEERLLSLRGRIDFAAQLRRPWIPSPIACRFDEFTADVDLNRYLLGSIDHLLRAAQVDPSTRALLRHARARFEGVHAIRPTLHQLDRITFDRLTEHYRPAIRLARLVIQNLSLADQLGGNDASEASSFLVDMNVVFEEFVTRQLGRALGGTLTVEAQKVMHLAEQRRVPIRPDLVFERAGQPVYVGDVKYKLAPTGIGRSSDYYQLLAYCTVLGLGEGVLVYAQVDDAKPDDTITVQNAGTRLTAYRLDLSGTAADIDRSIGQLARWIEGRTQMVASLAGRPTPSALAG